MTTSRRAVVSNSVDGDTPLLSFQSGCKQQDRIAYKHTIAIMYALYCTIPGFPTLLRAYDMAWLNRAASCRSKLRRSREPCLEHRRAFLGRPGCCALVYPDNPYRHTPEIYIDRPWHIMLNFYRIMLCSTANLVSQLCSDLRGKCS